MDDFRRNIYDRLYELVAGTGRDWILDGTFSDRAVQERFRALADARLVRVRADEGTALARNEVGEDAIDETGVHVVCAQFDDPDANLVVDTDELSIEAALDRLEEAVRKWIADWRPRGAGPFWGDQYALTRSPHNLLHDPRDRRGSR